MAKNILWLDDNWEQFTFLDSNKYDLRKDAQLALVLSKEISLRGPENNNYYVQTKRNSWLSSCQNRIDMDREHDLDMLNRLTQAGINVPDWWFIRDLIQLNSKIDPEKEYLIKSFDAARSLGQIRIYGHEYLDLLKTAKTLNQEEFLKNWKIDNSTIFSEEEKNTLHDRINSGKIYLSEIINFKQEFRINYFQGTPWHKFIIEERKGYLVNSSEKRSHKIISWSKSGIPKAILQKIKEFGDNHPSPMLSFDLYIKPDGEWGIFEYCTQFGVIYKGYPKAHKKLVKQMNRAMEEAIKAIKN